jgi:hypothetical protein
MPRHKRRGANEVGAVYGAIYGSIRDVCAAGQKLLECW